MKLLRYGPAGAEKPGMLDSDGRIRDLSAVVDDIGTAQLSPQGQELLASFDPETLPIVEGPVRYGLPFVGARKFLAIGLNYVAHTQEAKMELPVEPVVFTKAISCLSGPDDDVMLPRGATKGDWEVELGVVIGVTARNVSEEDALSHVAGYCLINDVSERAFQLERGGSWDKGKGCDTFGPVGPWLATADEVGDPQKLGLWLEVNGQRMQTGNTSMMVFSVQHIISYLSQFMTLEPGDIIATGTPPGVGMGMNPPVYLQPGDIMHLGIDGLGEQRQHVIAWEAASPSDAGSRTNAKTMASA